jgi:hypothetical protein
MKENYALRTGETRSKIASGLCAQMQKGKAGELLVECFDQSTFCRFLSEFCARAIAKGHKPEAVADMLLSLAGGNASQARQLAEGFILKLEGAEKEISLSTLWAKGGSSPIPPSALADI